ncbi:GAF domain-containing protein [Caldimonas tepidiphila]|uniref:GAF domain-containing protein n=1 Tax=Caldimonas tepidiphila TaxID=2315841 RepID=UPI000E5B5C02|nr:GAF domain-containing protein [Caldimonas tepidiphila]
MLPAPIPDDETERLAALHRIMLLDTPPEERFDRLVEFAAHELDMPIALISLLDEGRQWFKSRVGVSLAETPRDISFCAHTILGEELLVIEDASEDERFADNPLVTGEAHIRFYAGAPLKSPSGHKVGTLCVLDTRPRRLDHIERATLEALRDLIGSELAAREAERLAGGAG